MIQLSELFQVSIDYLIHGKDGNASKDVSHHMNKASVNIFIETEKRFARYIAFIIVGCLIGFPMLSAGSMLKQFDAFFPSNSEMGMDVPQSSSYHILQWGGILVFLGCCIAIFFAVKTYQQRNIRAFKETSL